MREAVIVDAVRTPIGRRNGKLKDIHPVVLGSLVLKEIVHRAGIKPELVEDVVFGCVSGGRNEALSIRAWNQPWYHLRRPRGRARRGADHGWPGHCARRRRGTIARRCDRAAAGMRRMDSSPHRSVASH